MATMGKPLGFLCVLYLLPVSVLGCGGAVSGAPGLSGSLGSPNYPNSYQVGAKCIWAFEVPSLYGLQFNITDLQLQTGSGSSCKDYLEIRDGNSSAALKFHGCSQNSTTLVQTTGRFAWVKFYSDHATVDRGFYLTWIVVHLNTDLVSLTHTCAQTLFTCPNYECIPHGSICDNVNDCGCVSYNCDEGDYYCKTAPIENWQKYTVGFCGGIGIFALIFIICAFLESRYNRFGGACAAQGKGPEEKEEASSRCHCCSCSCCLSCCCCGNKAKAGESEEHKDLEEAYSEIMRIMVGGKPIDWYEESKSASSTRNGSVVASRHASISDGQSAPGAGYGKTLHPTDTPAAVSATKKKGLKDSKAKGSKTVSV